MSSVPAGSEVDIGRSADRGAPAADVLGRAEPSEIVPVRHPAAWVATALVALAAVGVVRSMVTNDRFRWDLVAHYFLSPLVLRGLGNTLLLTAVAMSLGIALGVAVACLELAHAAALRGLAACYVWILRGTPLMVQLIILFNISALYPQVRIGLPLLGITPRVVDVNALLTPLLASVAALATNESAYMAEIVRAGLLSVPAGQRDAARALGMSPRLVFLRVVLPQAMRVIVPPTGNQVIGMLKSTSVVSVIAFPELLYSVQSIYSRTYQTIPMLLVACVQYLIVTTVLTLAQRRVERRFEHRESAPASSMPFETREGELA